MDLNLKNLIKSMHWKLFFYLFASFSFTTLRGNPWPNWLGPNFNGSLPEETIIIPPEGNDYLTKWSLRVGQGWSSPVVEQGLVVFHDREQELEVIHCYEIKSGKEMWRFEYKSEYRDDFGMEDGPRSTPCIRSGIVITHGPQGKVHAMRLEDGYFLWKRDLKKDFSSPKGFFGRCSSPLVIDDKVILDVGGRVGVVALSLKTGLSIWHSEPFGNDYSSPIPFVKGRESFCLSFMREGFAVFDLESGKTRYFDPFRSTIDASVNAASPLVFGNHVFLSSCYGVGAGLWSYKEKGSESEKFETVWKKKQILDCHYSTPVMHSGFLYGFHGRQERGPFLRCIEIKTGLVRWSLPSLGSGNLVSVGNKIVLLNEHGELILLEADPSEAKILHRQQILGTDAKSHFAISENCLIARDQRRLICLSLEVFE